MTGIRMLICFIPFMALSNPSSITKFNWLIGTWEMKNENGSSRLEVWEKQNDFTLKGIGLNVTGPDTSLLEVIELVYREDHFWYIPTVPDQNNALPVPFKLVNAEDLFFTFENPEHDFPQRIVYQFKPINIRPEPLSGSGDALLVRVESMDGRGMNFQFFRL